MVPVEKAVPVVSCLGPRNEDSMVFICAMRLETEGCIVVSDCMLIFILSIWVEALKMPCAEAVHALAPRAPESSSAFPSFLLEPDHTWIV